MIPRHEFEGLANQHHTGRSFRKATRWSQFVAMAMAQLSGRNSLRDIISSLHTQAHRLYHLGSAMLSRSNLARINEDKPYTLYEALFGKLLTRCQCFGYIKDWVEKKVRRHLMKARNIRGFGWDRWSRSWLYTGLGLFAQYYVRHPATESAANR